MELILGGRSEVTADSIGGGRLVAGPNQVLSESWMDGCTYRGIISPGEVETGRFPFLGYRCCGGSPPSP